MPVTFSAVIPVFNGARYIREAVDSALSQSRPADEIIVIDDGSTDETPALLSAYGARIQVIRTPNRGVAAARNAGVRASKSTHVAFLDGDDRWLPNKLAVNEDYFARHPGAGLVFSDASVIGPDGERRGVIRRRFPADGFFRAMLVENRVTLSTAVIPKGVFAKAGYFHEGFRCPAGVEDWEFFLRVAKFYSAVHIPELLAEYRVHRTSAIQTRRHQLREDALEVLDLHATEEVPAGIRSAARASVNYHSALRHLTADDLASARQDLIAALRHPRFAVRALPLLLAACLGGTVVRFLSSARRKVLSRG